MPLSYRKRQLINSLISVLAGIIIFVVASYFASKKYSSDSANSMKDEILSVVCILGSALIVIPIGGIIRNVIKNK